VTRPLIIIFSVFFVVAEKGKHQHKEKWGKVVWPCQTNILYSGKFGKFDESFLICQTKTIQISTYNYNLLAKSIHSPNFFSPNAQNENICQTFALPNFPTIQYHMAGKSDAEFNLTI